MPRMNLLLGGVFMGVFFWLLDSFNDSRLMGGQSIWGELFSPVPLEIWMRSSFLAICTAYGFYAQRVVNRLDDSRTELRQGEERLRLALEAANEGSWDWDLGTGKVHINPQWETMLGYEPGELGQEANALMEFIHPDDKEMVRIEFTKHLKGECPYYESTHRLRTKNGDWIWVIDHGRVVSRSEDGRALRAVGTQVDITKRMLTENELAAYRESLQSKLDERTAELRRTDEILRRELMRRTTADRAMRSIVEGTSSSTGADFFPAVVKYLARSLGVRYAFVCEHRNASEVSALTRATWLGDHHGEPMEYPVRGTPCEAVVKGNISFHGEDVQRSFPEDEWLVEFGVQSYLGLPFRDSANDIIGHLVIMDDKAIEDYDYCITVLKVFAARAGAEMERILSEESRRQAEARAQFLQRVDSLGLLAGAIAHDFNNLLVGIVSNAHMALEDIPADSPEHECIAEILDSGNHASELSHQLLAYSGKGKFTSEAVNPSSVIREMSRLLKTAVSKQVSLELNLSDSSGCFEADFAQIKQVVMNLVTNASDAYEGNCGTVTLTTGEKDCSAADLENAYIATDFSGGKYAFIEVKDRGCGVDAQTLDRMFEPFYTTKDTGRGLGLASVLGIVRGHEGAIFIESKIGYGTTITVVFPLGSTAKIEELPVATDSNDRTGSGVVLIVDDNETVRSTAKRLLERNGFSTLQAANGREGIELFEKHADKIACVLLDLSMDDVSGDVVLAEMRRIRQDIPVVLSSGYADTEVLAHIHENESIPIVQKPYEPQELLAALRSVIVAADGLRGSLR